MKNPNSSSYRLRTADIAVPACLLALSLIPAIGAGARLLHVAQDTTLTPDNARFMHAPVPVVIHAIAATVYSLLGAFQFSRGYLIRWPKWHRRAGVVLALAGLATGLTGIWMTLFYAIPQNLQGPFLYWVRLGVGGATVAFIVIAWRSILRRQVARHEAFMVRAYALAQGAGTQAIVLLPWMLATGETGGPTRDVLMTLAWLINIVAAELIVGKGKRSRMAVSR